MSRFPTATATATPSEEEMDSDFAPTFGKRLQTARSLERRDVGPEMMGL